MGLFYLRGLTPPPPPDFGYKSVGSRIRQRCSKGVVNRRDQPQIWPRKTDLNAEQGLMTTKCRIIDGVGQGPCKSGVRRDQAALRHDQVRSVRLRTDGGQFSRRSAVPEWAHSTVPKRGSGFKCPTCRAANGSIRRSGDPRCTVLITVLVRQQWQATATPVRRAQQVQRYIRPKDNGLIALLAACE